MRVLASSITIGAFFFSDAAMSVIGAIRERRNARAVASPGTLRISCEPGLNPSSRFWSVVSMRTPALFAGVQRREMFTRRLVDVRRRAW